MEVDRREALRYLGYKRGVEPDAQTESVLNACIPALQNAARFRCVSLKVKAGVEGEEVTLGPLTVPSRGLARHLAGCAEAYLFAATLGAGVDRLMHLYESTDLPAAVVLQACAAALLESCCDEAQAQIAAGLPDGFSLRPRFSPGYGDFMLDFQPDLLRILDAPRKIGLTCTRSNMLAPVKSVTAVMGVKPGPGGTAGGCEGCSLPGCAYKKE